MDILKFMNSTTEEHLGHVKTFSVTNKSAIKISGWMSSTKQGKYIRM